MFGLVINATQSWFIIKDRPSATTPDNGRGTRSLHNYFDRHTWTVEQYLRRPTSQLYRRYVFPSKPSPYNHWVEAGRKWNSQKAFKMSDSFFVSLSNFFECGDYCESKNRSTDNIRWIATIHKLVKTKKVRYGQLFVHNITTSFPTAVERGRRSNKKRFQIKQKIIFEMNKRREKSIKKKQSCNSCAYKRLLIIGFMIIAYSRMR